LETWNLIVDYQFPVSVVFRYWRKNKLFQLQTDTTSIANAIKIIHNTSKKCEIENLEWLGEIFPFASEPMVYGSRKGIEHRKQLF
jgi:hypothetical protein